MTTTITLPSRNCQSLRVFQAERDVEIWRAIEQRAVAIGEPAEELAAIRAQLAHALKALDAAQEGQQ